MFLQLVEGDDDNTRNRTDTDLFKELRQNDQIHLYFDEDATKNALADGCQTIETRVRPDTASDSTENQKPNKRG